MRCSTIYLPTIFFCSFRNCEFHFYRNVFCFDIYLQFFFFCLFLLLLAFFVLLPHSTRCFLLMFLDFFPHFALCSPQFEMECIALFGRCAAERVSVFDYLHKISNENKIGLLYHCLLVLFLAAIVFLPLLLSLRLSMQLFAFSCVCFCCAMLSQI